MADETEDEDLKALTSKLSIKPYRPNPSFLSEAGQALIAQSMMQPQATRSDYYGSMATKLAGALLGGFGRQEEMEETRGAYGRLNQMLSSKNPGLAIAQDPYWYDVAPSLMLDTYERQGKIADQTAIAKMKTREKYAGDYMNVDPETQQTSFYPGLVESQGQQKYTEAAEGAKGRLEQEKIYQPQIDQAKANVQLAMSPQIKTAETKATKLGERIAEAMTPSIEVQPGSKEAMKTEDTVRGELATNPVVKTFPILESYYSQMVKSYRDRGPGSDNSIVFGVNKMVDALSAVRGEEQRNAASAGGLRGEVDRLMGIIQSEGRINDDTRAGLIEVGTRAYDMAAEQTTGVLDKYRGILKQRGGTEAGAFVVPIPKSSRDIISSAGILPEIEAYRRNYVGQAPAPAPIPGEKPSEALARIRRERAAQQQPALKPGQSFP